MLSCYDATLRLAPQCAAAARGALAPASASGGGPAPGSPPEPTFLASYPAMGRMPAVLECGVTQRRLRAAPVRCAPMDVYYG